MKVKLTSEDEEKIYELYKNGISMKNIADQYGTSFNRISKTINNYCFTHNVPKPISLQERKAKELPLKTIIERMRNGECISNIAKEYFISYVVLKKELLNDEEGKKLFYYDEKKGSYLIKKKKEFNIGEIVNAYQNNRLKDFAKENNISTSSLRCRLRNKYGDDYSKILINKEEDKNDNNKIAKLYENGFNVSQIAKDLRTKYRLYKKRNK